MNALPFTEILRLNLALKSILAEKDHRLLMAVSHAMTPKAAQAYSRSLAADMAGPGMPAGGAGANGVRVTPAQLNAWMRSRLGRG